MNPIIIIPARLAATRLPNKPLADIGGKPMIVRTLEACQAAAMGPVIVATDSDAIADVVTAAGGEAVMTRADHPSGSDRVFEALQRVDPTGRHDVVINMQGDYPLIASDDIKAALSLMHDMTVDIGTLAVTIDNDADRTDPNVVKIVGSEVADRHLRALYFTRATAPHGDGPLYHHIGIYAYRAAALARFVALPPSRLEIRERLEQLRALEDGMRIDAGIVDTVPVGVDTPADLDAARRLVAARI